MFAEKKVTIKNKSGLHARPAALFVQKANCYESEIYVSKGDQKVNGKSIMGILMLAAEKGQLVTITAKGEDAKIAVTELSTILIDDSDFSFGGKKK